MAALDELKQNDMMAHLISSLGAGKDIGHYGRLTFVMVAKSFLDEDQIVEELTKDPDCDEEKARTLVQQVEARGYNPPKRERILEWMGKQDFPICPDSENPDSCNVYKDINFPKDVYDKISSYYHAQSNS